MNSGKPSMASGHSGQGGSQGQGGGSWITKSDAKEKYLVSDALLAGSDWEIHTIDFPLHFKH